jgi:hypothetical protein
MSVKELLLLPFVALSMIASASSFAEEQPRSMLGSFDLKSAILSPSPLGPPSQFVSPQVVPPPAVATAKIAAPRRIVSRKPRQKTAVAARKPKSNPLDSYARESRRQTWPCVGEGICAWR